VGQSEIRVRRNAPAAGALPLTHGNVSGKALAAGRGQARLKISDFRLNPSPTVTQIRVLPVNPLDWGIAEGLATRDLSGALSGVAPAN